MRAPGVLGERAAVAAAVALLVACGGDDGAAGTDAALTDAAPVDAAVPVDAAIDAFVFVPPTLLSETGLYSDLAAKTVAAGNVEFTPRWQLWSDAATKRRWIQLPAGTEIDTSTMDDWSFPMGTKLWKEFVRDGRRVETRLLQKIGPTDGRDDWFMMSFAWNAGETEATAVPDGVVDGGGHDDIPSRAACLACHRDIFSGSVVLGFSALQLDTAPAAAGQPSLATLVADDLLTDPPAGSLPYFPLPAGDAVSEPAFGYMHANCGSCHNPESAHFDAVPLALRLATGSLTSWAATAPYTTTVDRPLSTGAPGATAVVEPGSPGQSALYLRFTSTGMNFQMPKLGREVVDPTGRDAITAWIDSLPATP